MQRFRIPAPMIVVALACAWFADSRALAQPADASHLVCGIAHKISGSKFEIETRSGKVVRVDATNAIQADRRAILYEGTPVSAEGAIDKGGVLHAETVNRLKNSRSSWPPDR